MSNPKTPKAAAAVAAAAAPALATTTVAGVVREVPVISAVSTSIPLPPKADRRGNKSTYNFSVLNVIGASFGVKNKTLEQVKAVVLRENRKHVTSYPDPQDATKKIKTSSQRLEAYSVDPKTDPDGAQVRVFRVE